MVDRSEMRSGSVRFSLHRSYAVLLAMATMLLVWLFAGRNGELAAHQMLIPAAPTIEGWLTHPLFHASGVHLSLNLLVILFAGGVLETFWGTQRFLVFSFIIAMASAAISFAVGRLAESTSLFAHVTTRSYGASGLAFAYLLWVAVAFPRTQLVRGVTVRQFTWATIFLGAAGLAWLEIACRGSRSLQGTLLLPQVSTIATSMLYVWIEPRWHALRRHRAAQRVQRERERVVDLRLQVDELLDKISEDGYDSLTPREKSFLRQASKHYRS